MIIYVTKEGLKLVSIHPHAPQAITDLASLNILSNAKSITRVKEPYWTNNVTRLNETNMNALRDNLINYLDQALASTYRTVAEDINEVIKRTAGWQQVSADKRTYGELGEIFSDYINNSTDSKYSAVFGENNKVGKNQEGQFIVGRYAATPEEIEDNIYALFVIGNGTSDTDRANALIVKTDGSVDIAGKLSLGDILQLENGLTITNGGLQVSGNSEVVGNLIVTKAPTSQQHVVRKKELDALREEISGDIDVIDEIIIDGSDAKYADPSGNW